MSTTTTERLRLKWRFIETISKAWYVGPGIDPEKMAKWKIRNQQPLTLDPRREFSEALRSIGGIVEGEHPIMDGKGHRLATEKDKRGEAAIFYRAYLDGVPNGYAENNRTKEVKRWKARGQGLSDEQRAELLADVEKKDTNGTTLSHSMGLTCSSKEVSTPLATGSHWLRIREISRACQ